MKKETSKLMDRIDKKAKSFKGNQTGINKKREMLNFKIKLRRRREQKALLMKNKVAILIRRSKRHRHLLLKKQLLRKT